MGKTVEPMAVSASAFMLLRIISMLLGIPHSWRTAIRDYTAAPMERLSHPHLLRELLLDTCNDNGKQRAPSHWHKTSTPGCWEMPKGPFLTLLLRSTGTAHPTVAPEQRTVLIHRQIAPRRNGGKPAPVPLLTTFLLWEILLPRGTCISTRATARRSGG